jgi:phosphohistidine phosphatase
MRLMVHRHASSEKAEPGMRDLDRALNERGRKDAAKIGAYMAHHALLPDQVIVSPARRAKETLEPVSEAYGRL